MGKILCLRSQSADSVYTYVQNSEATEMEKNVFFSSWLLWQKILFIVGIVLLSLLLLTFIIGWVIFPLVFMNTYSLQRFVIFWNFQDPKNPEFNHPEKYDMEGTVNFYLTTKDTDNSSLLSLGLWLVLPESEIKSTVIKSHDKETAADLIKNTPYPIVLYLHGVGANRAKVNYTYKALRHQYMIIAPDHRGYGDSSPGIPPSELGIISDSCQIFKWIRQNTNNDIYVWGHSLGTGISTHTVRSLKEDHKIVPMGLILESVFTTIRELVPATGLGKIFSWLPWFDATILDPLDKNGLLFRTTSNILHVDCPIMILHAEDDTVIPYTMGKKVVEVASTKRNITLQGNVTYHQFPRILGYQHTGITTDPNIPKYVKEFIGYCKDQNKRRD